MRGAGKAGQRGVTAVIVTVAMFSVLAIVGLALDAGHVFTNKSRAQTVVDATALAAAKVLDQSGTTAQATSAANAVYAANRAAYPELNADGSLSLSIQYSNTLLPFAPGTVPAQYVRVTLTNFETGASLSRVLGRSTFNVTASAVAGPSPAIGSACNIAPVVACGDAAAGPPYYGYQTGRLQVLKYGAQGNSPLGPGNFQLLRLNGNGASVVRENLAGAFSSCANTGTTADTQPGNDVGPTVQGLNTRFNQYTGGLSSTDYPPDVLYSSSNQSNLRYDTNTDTITQNGIPITLSSQASFNYAIYQARVAAGQFDQQPRPTGNAAYRRREIAVPIGNCSAGGSGATTVPILGFGCFFLLQEAQQQGNGNSTRGAVFGEFISDCTTGGRAGPAPTTSPGPHVLQLYRDQVSPDS